MKFVFSCIYSFFTDGILYVILLLPLYILCRYIFVRKKMKKTINFQTSFFYEIAAAGLFIYLIMLFTQTFIVNSGKNAIELVPFRIIITQFYEMLTSRTGLKKFIFNIIGNIGVFIPIGIITAYLFGGSLKKTILSGSAISVFIEVVQLPLQRTTDIDDVILNTTGTVIGFFLYQLINMVLKKRAVKK